MHSKAIVACLTKISSSNCLPTFTPCVSITENLLPWRWLFTYCLDRTQKHYFTPTQEDTVVRLTHWRALIKTIFIVSEAQLNIYTLVHKINSKTNFLPHKSEKSSVATTPHTHTHTPVQKRFWKLTLQPTLVSIAAKSNETGLRIDTIHPELKPLVNHFLIYCPYPKPETGQLKGQKNTLLLYWQGFLTFQVTFISFGHYQT